MAERIRILVADDHPLFREGVVHSLASEPDLTVLGQAASGEEALRMARDLLPDVVLLDIGMPEMNGYEVARAIRKRFPDARFAFNWSSSFKWFNDPNPTTFAELGEMGVKFIFITLGGQHAEGYGLSNLLQDMAAHQEQGYIHLQRQEWVEDGDYPTRSHHFFSGVPYHHLVGKLYDASRLGLEFVEHVSAEKVV